MYVVSSDGWVCHGDCKLGEYIGVVVSMFDWVRKLMHGGAFGFVRWHPLWWWFNGWNWVIKFQTWVGNNIWDSIIWFLVLLVAEADSKYFQNSFKIRKTNKSFLCQMNSFKTDFHPGVCSLLSPDEIYCFINALLYIVPSMHYYIVEVLGVVCF